MNATVVPPPGGSERKLYSEIMGNGENNKRFKITVTSKKNQTSNTIKETFKTNINPTEIKVGIKALKVLRNRKVLTETNSKEETVMLGKDINDKCGDKLEKHNHKLRNPRLVLLNIPEGIAMGNLEGTLLAQNPGLKMAKGDVNVKFIYKTKNALRT